MNSGASSTPATSAAAAAARKPNPGSPWTDQETSHLIDAYEERWYALKRGQLRAQQWEQIAGEITARCGFAAPSKNGTQCRHKIEKLRKRYRADLLRPARSPWPFFPRMDRMERGPPPASEDDQESNTRSINGILKGKVAKRGREGTEEGDLVEELRRFGEGYVRMERKRMDVMREIEREWMGMEARRMEMILEAQRGIMEMIAVAFEKKKKKKKKKNSVDL